MTPNIHVKASGWSPRLGTDASESRHRVFRQQPTYADKMQLLIITHKLEFSSKEALMVLRKYDERRAFGYSGMVFAYNIMQV